MSGMSRLTAQIRRIRTKLHGIHQFEDPLFCSLCSMYAAVRTDSPKCLLTRPLNGWKPDSRILLAGSELDSKLRKYCVRSGANWSFAPFERGNRL